MDDIKIVTAGLRRLQFTRDEIITLRNPAYQDIKKAIDESSASIYETYTNENHGKTLLFVYYAGHGMMDNSTYCVVNGPRMYPMEKNLRCIAKQEGSYVVAVFDCCREKMPVTATRGGGGGAAMDDDANEMLGQEETNHENFIITYGCQPSAGVALKSTIAKTYFRYLRRSSQSAKFDHELKLLELPGCLNFFQNTDGKCEHSIKAAQPLLLFWKDRLVGKKMIDAFAT